MSVQPMSRAVSGNFSIAGFLSQCDSKQKTRQPGKMQLPGSTGESCLSEKTL